jgi:hypothetical protein
MQSNTVWYVITVTASEQVQVSCFYLFGFMLGMNLLVEPTVTVRRRYCSLKRHLDDADLNVQELMFRIQSNVWDTCGHMLGQVAQLLCCVPTCAISSGVNSAR